MELSRDEEAELELKAEMVGIYEALRQLILAKTVTNTVSDGDFFAEKGKLVEAFSVCFGTLTGRAMDEAGVEAWRLGCGIAKRNPDLAGKSVLLGDGAPKQGGDITSKLAVQLERLESQSATFLTNPSAANSDPLLRTMRMVAGFIPQLQRGAVVQAAFLEPMMQRLQSDPNTTLSAEETEKLAADIMDLRTVLGL